MTQQGHLRITAVSKQFRVNGVPLQALDRVELAVAPGQFLTIVGRYGLSPFGWYRIAAGLALIAWLTL